jgi:hypothetical protein
VEQPRKQFLTQTCVLVFFLLAFSILQAHA